MTLASDIVLWTDAASTTAQRVDMLFFFMLTACGAVGTLVVVLMVYFCIRYRRRPGEVGNPPPTQQSRALEWFWTLSPLLVFATAFIWGGRLYFSAYNAPDDATPVYVVAKQWMWKFQHPEGQREISTLHVPVGKPIKLLMISEDVIHSFFVPAFRVHMDVLPQRFTSVWFQVVRPGTYHLFCSQYCGTGHAEMTGQIIAMPPADYQRWLNLHAEGSLALKGRQVFLKYRCLSCHSADQAARAPVLENLYGRPVALSDGSTVIADRDYLLRSIFHPSDQIVMGYQDIMPPFQGQVTTEEAVALIAFIQSLQAGGTPQRVESFPPPNKAPVAPDESANPTDSTQPKDTTP